MSRIVMSRMLHGSRRFDPAPESSPFRRGLLAALLGGALSLSLPLSLSALAAPASAAPATSTGDRGLFGSADPTYDGVPRQSLAIVGLDSAGIDVPTSAVSWLVDQQCPDGSFASYRADTSLPCPPSDPQAYSGPDTNSTALAALALNAVGQTAAARDAITWLISQRSTGGGWVWIPGGTPDTSSTGLALAAVQALRPAGTAPAVRAARNFLHRAQAPCTASIQDRFGMPFQAGLNPDTFSSSQSLLGLSDAFPVREKSQRRAIPRVTCAEDGRATSVTDGVARWVARQLNTHDGALPNTYDPTSVDWNSTALSILSLVALRTAGIATDKAVTALENNIEEYIGSDSGDRPAALGTSMLVTTATGLDPRDFGGADLATRLLATVQE